MSEHQFFIAEFLIYGMATKQRSILKSLSWRVIAFIITFIIAMLLLDDPSKSFTLSLAIHSLNIFIYYFHERLWNRIEWGKVEGVPYHLFPPRSIIGAILHPGHKEN